MAFNLFIQVDRSSLIPERLQILPDNGCFSFLLEFVIFLTRNTWRDYIQIILCTESFCRLQNYLNV